MSKLIAQTLPEADKLTVDPMHYYRQVLHGYYNFNCYVSEGVTRTAKFYIPEGSVYNQPTIFLARSMLGLRCLGSSPGRGS